eukprot:CAMPEP_0179481204 /NCGR_PEP_ID=MMETSP0799-20121207/59000_1 /TAXON_ID=46947 /ORGANISM="Geminigera cryophila, Strain CCMP2564" /LENGTH=45 /DNA_ID=CAMNT_0021293713 /DNA_START=18 /DNA_END=151 /DNA_ORIENTATION=+
MPRCPFDTLKLTIVLRDVDNGTHEDTVHHFHWRSQRRRTSGRLRR